MIGNWMMGVAANSTSKELAVKFLEFITSSETQKRMVEHGGVPTRKSVYLDSELASKYKHFPVMLEALQNSCSETENTVMVACGRSFGCGIVGCNRRNEVRRGGAGERE